MNEVELQMLIDEAELAKAEPRLMAPAGIAIALMFELGLSHVWIANAPCRVRLRAKGPNGAGFDFDIECDSFGFTSSVQNVEGEELRLRLRFREAFYGEMAAILRGKTGCST